MGSPPAYVSGETDAPSSPATPKYNALRQAVIQGRPGLGLYRQAFIKACLAYADALRVREKPDLGALPERVLEDCGRLKRVRDHVVDWVLLEARAAPSDEFREALLQFLESLRELKSRPPEIGAWNDAWFEAHSLFVYETFLYIVASLIETRSFEILHEVFTSHYLLPEVDDRGDGSFGRFDDFWSGSQLLQQVLAPEGKRLLSPAADLLKRQADRDDLPFKAVMEADLLAYLMALLSPDAEWYPATLLYASRGRNFTFFLRAAQHKHFLALATVTGIDRADDLRAAVRRGSERLDIQRWHSHPHGVVSDFLQLMNIDKLDSLK